VNRYIVEFIATFFLMLTIVCVVNGNPSDNYFPPLAVGAMLIGLIYAGGHVSKAHYNPAVTLAFYLRGKFPASQIPGYVIAQFLGAILAALIGVYVFEKVGSNPVDLGSGGLHASVLNGFVAEFLGTFALVWVILNVATAKSTEANGFYGIAIGLTVVGGAYAFGDFGTYACFNPAVALGTVLNGLNTGFNFGIIVLANFLAGGVAALVFRYSYGVKN